MARGQGISGRGPGSDDEGSAESESGIPSDPTPEQAAKEPRKVGRFMAWLGYGPESEPEPEAKDESWEPATELQARTGADDDPEPEPAPPTEEWQVPEAEPSASSEEPSELVEDTVAS